jgi:hypothetical protein
MISPHFDNLLILLASCSATGTVRRSSSVTNGLMQDARSGPNPLLPAHLSADERLNELASILAAGLMRILPEQSSSLSAPGEDRSFDILALKRRVGRRKPNNPVGGQ